MKAWLLDEGTPGHTVQTAGLGGLLEDSGWDTLWLQCRLKLRGWKRPFVRFSAGRKRREDALKLATRLYPDFIMPTDRRVDLIVSSCGKSAYLSRLLSAATGARNVFIGERHPFPAAWFSLVVTPVAEGIANEMLMPVIETGRSAEGGLEAERSRWPGGSPQACWTLLIGGSSRTHRYSESDWRSLAAGINAMAGKHGIRWLLSTSRRTGAEGERLLREWVDPHAIQEAVWYGSEPAKVVGAYLSAGDRVFVTQDSLTMMSEALAIGKSVILLTPRNWEMPPESFNGRYVSRLAGEGLVGRLAIDGLEDYSPVDDGRVDLSPRRKAFAEAFLIWAEKGGGGA